VEGAGRVTIVTLALPRHTCVVILARAVLPVAFVLAACSSAASFDGTPAASPTAAPSTEVVKVVTRDRSILLSTRQHAVRATLLDANGKLIVQDVSIDELQSIDATAYDAVKSSVAAKDRPYEDPALAR
jgi:hypothetical protein